jgi:hypothetical protein
MNGQQSTKNNSNDTRTSKADKGNATGKPAMPQRGAGSAPQPSKQSGKRPAKG